MKKLFSLHHSLELLAVLITAGAILAVLQSFIIGKHYIIPTAFFVLAVLFGNLARFGLRGERWAQHLLFWIFTIAAVHTFFALFWAAKPRELLGEAFIYAYAIDFLLLSFLSWQYARKNKLFS